MVLDLVLGLLSKLVDSVPAVEGAADLLVRLDEPLQLDSQVSVLANQHVAVVLKSVDLSLDVGVLALQGLVREAQVVLLLLAAVQLALSAAALALQVVELRGQVAVASAFLLEPLGEVALLGLFAVEGALRLALVVLEASGLISRSEQVEVGGVISLSGLLEVVVAALADFGEFLGSLLQLEQVVVGGLDALVGVSVLALLVAIAVAEAVNLLLVPGALLLELLEFEGGAVDIFAQGVGVVTLGLHLALEPEDLSFTARNLLTEGSDLNLHVVVAAALIVEVESGVVALLLEPVEADAVGVLAGLKLVFLAEFFVLKVTVLGLDAVELISQREVVLVSLLDLKDLGLELADKQVFLVTCEMHTIVILNKLSQRGVSAYS